MLRKKNEKQNGKKENKNVPQEIFEDVDEKKTIRGRDMIQTDGGRQEERSPEFRKEI